MDNHWKSLATQQRELISEKNAVINKLRQQLQLTDSRTTNLHVHIIDHIDKLLEVNVDPSVGDRLSKLALEVRHAYPDSKTAFQKAPNAKLEVENEKSTTSPPSAPNRLEQMLAENRNLQAQLANAQSTLSELLEERNRLRISNERLQRQLQAEKAHNPIYGSSTKECDDEEVLPPIRHRATYHSVSKTATSQLQHSLDSDMYPSVQQMLKQKQNQKASQLSPTSTSTNNRKRLAEGLEESAYRDSPSKRKREAHAGASLEDEVRDLRVCTGPQPRSKKRNTRSTKNLRETEDFAFQAIQSYDASGEVVSVYTHEDLSNIVPDLWERIENRRDEWEALKGADWQYDFERNDHKTQTRQCVDRKLHKLRTKWLKENPGMFACRDCAQSGRPCFTFDDDDKFLLLPLHEQDRLRAVTKDFETRYWINDGGWDVLE